MDLYNSFKDGNLAGKLVDYLHSLAPEPATFMEVCGTHTVAIARHGIRQLMPDGIRLTSGPGCPVCVTAAADIDRFIAATEVPGAIVATFGDLVRVPGSRSTLKKEMEAGADVRVVYSPLDAVELARKNPERQIIFLGVGFETTAPTVAGAILQARAEKLGNFSVISSHKIMPPALEVLASDPQIALNGLICPGHVSIIIGAAAYRPLAERYRMPCVITGFEPVDIMQGIIMLVKQRMENRPTVEIAYRRAVTEEGNEKARQILAEIFTPCPASWRGIGEIAGSGLAIGPAFSDFDAQRRFELEIGPVVEPRGCKCGEVLKGIIEPAECRLFGRACLPEHPVGPCMVSSEGACAAHYRYGGKV